jgi:hypothetical protein
MKISDINTSSVPLNWIRSFFPRVHFTPETNFGRKELTRPTYSNYGQVTDLATLSRKIKHEIYAYMINPEMVLPNYISNTFSDFIEEGGNYRDFYAHLVAKNEVTHIVLKDDPDFESLEDRYMLEDVQKESNEKEVIYKVKIIPHWHIQEVKEALHYIFNNDAFQSCINRLNENNKIVG